MDKSAIDNEVSRIVEAGALGRSPAYERLLRYLAQRAVDDTRPKEIDIATDVFARENFDPANDSTVRVYLHNLRQKMDAFYATDEGNASQRIVIPKGDYRVALVAEPAKSAAKSAAPSPPEANRLVWILALSVAAVAIAFFAGRMSAHSTPDAVDQMAQSAFWGPLLDDELSITVVVGDYYVFAEQNQFGMLDRLIRDFGINNKDDFDDYIDADPRRADLYQDVRLTYLPTGVGAALNDFLRVPHGAGKAVNVIPQSDFSAQVMRAGHVVYIGYLSGMDSLSLYAFGASRLKLGASYDELIDTETGDSFMSRAGFNTDAESGYTDYGFVSSFPGPADNHFLFISGMRDEALMQMASTLTDPAKVKVLTEALSTTSRTDSAVEALYKVSSLDRTHLSAELLFVHSFDASALWQSN